MRFGLFDSGIGGFTVLKKVIELCPNSSFIYLADTARLPYGVKTSNEIKKIAEEISYWYGLARGSCRISTPCRGCVPNIGDLRIFPSYSRERALTSDTLISQKVRLSKS